MVQGPVQVKSLSVQCPVQHKALLVQDYVQVKSLYVQCPVRHKALFLQDSVHCTGVLYRLKTCSVRPKALFVYCTVWLIFPLYYSF